jgi:hypothetical protein
MRLDYLVRVQAHAPYTICFCLSKQQQTLIATLSAWGLNPPLKHAEARNKRLGVSEKG